MIINHTYTISTHHFIYYISYMDRLAILREIREFEKMIYILSVSGGFIHITHIPVLLHMKNTLHASPYQYTIFRHLSALPWTFKPLIGFLCDYIYPFKRRVKSWLILTFMSTLLSSLYIYLYPSTFTSFTICMFIIEICKATELILANGMCVIVVNLYKSLDQLADRDTDDKGLVEIDIPEDIKKYKEGGKQLYGNQTILKFITKSVTIFLSGLYGGDFSISTFFIVLSISSTITALYAVFIFVETKKEKWVQQSDIRSTLKETLDIYKHKDILYPVLLMFIMFMCPQTYDPGNYILLNHGGWTSLDMSTVFIFFGFVYTVGMYFLINHVKSLSFGILIYISVLSQSLTNMTNYRFLFYDDISFRSMYLITFLNGIFHHLNIDIILIAIIGRFSLKCAKGIESFATSTISAFMYVSTTISGFIGAFIVKYLDVREGNYDYFDIALMISFVYGLLPLICTPILNK